MEQPPIYIKVDRQEDLRATISGVEQRVASASALADRLAGLQAEEERILRTWTENTTDTRARLKVLLEETPKVKAPTIPVAARAEPKTAPAPKTNPTPEPARKRTSSELERLRQQLDDVGSRLRTL